jgi:hypothetical protein
MTSLLGPAGTREAGAEQPLSEVRDECLAGYGSDLLAYLLGAGAGAPLRSWRLSEAIAAAPGEQRLRTAHLVLAQFKDPVHARAWLRRANPMLGGRTPASVLRDAADERGLLPVIEAAELPTG